MLNSSVKEKISYCDQKTEDGESALTVGIVGVASGGVPEEQGGGKGFGGGDLDGLG